MHRHSPTTILFCLLAFLSGHLFAQNLAPASAPQKVIFDTDIGDDIDDAFALGLLLSSPEVQVLGITTAWKDTHLRGRLVERFLCEVGRSDIPVAVGDRGTKPGTEGFSQARWAAAFPEPAKPWPNAVDFILDAIAKNPGEVTLISVAPLSNVGALIDKDPATFRKLKQVVIMGGSVHRGYGDLGYLPDRGPDPEYNIRVDIPSARKLFAAGVPVYVMPLDSTQMKLDEVQRDILFSEGKPLTDVLTLLYHEWSTATRNPTPTLFDAVAVAEAIQPDLCPSQPMRLRVDDQGYTRVEPGVPNALVCLDSSPDRFFEFYMHRVLTENLKSSASDLKCR